MKICFVFCHGFGFDKNFWNNLTALFKKDFCVFLDLGYFEEKQDLPCLDCNTILVGIGHSLGFTKLLKLKEKLDCLIGLNAFANFLGNNSNLYKKRYQELESMKNSFFKYPYLTLKRFYERCNVQYQSDSLSKLKREVLEKDFDDLFKAFYLKQNIPVLILGSRDDPVVPIEVIEDNFAFYNNVTVKLLDKGKHALGYLETKEVYERIKSFVYGIYQKKDYK